MQRVKETVDINQNLGSKCKEVVEKHQCKPDVEQKPDVVKNQENGRYKSDF